MTWAQSPLGDAGDVDLVADTELGEHRRGFSPAAAWTSSDLLRVALALDELVGGGLVEQRARGRRYG